MLLKIIILLLSYWFETCIKMNLPGIWKIQAVVHVEKHVKIFGLWLASWTEQNVCSIRSLEKKWLGWGLCLTLWETSGSSVGWCRVVYQFNRVWCGIQSVIQGNSVGSVWENWAKTWQFCFFSRELRAVVSDQALSNRTSGHSWGH